MFDAILDPRSSYQKMDMPEYLFVYGTLRPRMAPPKLAHLMKKMRYMGRGSTQGRLYDLEAYPGAILDPDCDTEIKGEIFQLPDDDMTLAMMDAYEGFDSRYPDSSLFVRRRCRVTLKDDSKLLCWIYVYNWHVSSEDLIRSGDYLWHRKLKSLRRSAKKDVRGSGSEN